MHPFTVAEARAAGLSRAQLRTSSYRQVIHGVYVEACVPDSVELRARAVAKVLPDDAAAGLETAAWLHRVDLRRPGDVDIDVIAQRGDQIRRRGIRATSAQLDAGDVKLVFGVPVTTPTRTAFDLARNRPLVEAVAVVDAMLNQGGCDLAELQDYVATHRKWRGVRRVDAALPHAEPLAQSLMESRQRMRLVLAGLPRPRAQTPVADERGRVFAYIDNGYDEWRVGADYDGDVHAGSWRRDLERQERIRDQAWWHRRYTSMHITNGWTQMVDQVAAALYAAGWRPAA